jgi:hypothetical protein
MFLHSQRGVRLTLLGLLVALFVPTANVGSTAPVGVCPPVSNTTKYTIAYGSATVGGAAAPVGAVVETRSPRGDAVGCWIVTTAGSYGMMYIYGEDTSVSPTIPGMRAGETVVFRVDGNTASATPSLTWANDGQSGSPHQIDLAASATSPVAPAITATRSGSTLILNWAHATANATYQVRRGTTPYFTPSGGDLIGDGATGNCTNNGVTVTCTHANAIGNPDIHNFYVVRAFNTSGASVDSNRVGEFDFALTPGNSLGLQSRRRGLESDRA